MRAGGRWRLWSAVSRQRPQATGGCEQHAVEHSAQVVVQCGQSRFIHAERVGCGSARLHCERNCGNRIDQSSIGGFAAHECVGSRIAG